MTHQGEGAEEGEGKDKGVFSGGSPSVCCDT